jgi:hypothetical protein
MIAADPLVGMALGSYLVQPEHASLVKKFHVIMNTPIGQEQRLIKAGIALPALDINKNGIQKEDRDSIAHLYEQDAEDKIFGSGSPIELRREKTLPWYFPGFICLTLTCFALIFFT